MSRYCFITLTKTKQIFFKKTQAKKKKSTKQKNPNQTKSPTQTLKQKTPQEVAKNCFRQCVICSGFDPGVWHLFLISDSLFSQLTEEYSYLFAQMVYFTFAEIKREGVFFFKHDDE